MISPERSKGKGVIMKDQFDHLFFRFNLNIMHKGLSCSLLRASREKQMIMKRKIRCSNSFCKFFLMVRAALEDKEEKNEWPLAPRCTSSKS